MKHLKLFPKTFLHCFGLMAGMMLAAFLLIYSLLPSGYRAYKQRELTSDARQLAVRLQAMSSERIADEVRSFAVSHNYAYSAVYEDGEVICAGETSIGIEVIGGTREQEGAITLEMDIAESEARFSADDGKTVCLTLKSSLQPVGEAMSVLLSILPVVLLCCLPLCAGIAWLYARSITKPMRHITEETVKMQALLPDAACEVKRADEIGLLSRNINDMYRKLLTTIADLEREVQTVSKAEQEKLDFLLLASHELKTPVTAVRGMIDGMIYRVGVYKDRDTYLKECQKALEDLTDLLCRILETSKIDANTAAKNRGLTDVGALLEQTASPYLVIAKSRGIDMTLESEPSLFALVSADLVGKALSNVISNAVRYTEAGKAIRIFADHQAVVVENECRPLSEEELAHIGEPFYHPGGAADSTGLGLYFTHRILSACGLTYSFASYEKGMRFLLNLNSI